MCGLLDRNDGLIRLVRIGRSHLDRDQLQHRFIPRVGFFRRKLGRFSLGDCGLGRRFRFDHTRFDGFGYGRCRDLGRRVGLIAFREFISSTLTALQPCGLEIHDLELDVQAFNVQLPRLRIIPLDEFDPVRYL